MRQQVVLDLRRWSPYNLVLAIALPSLAGAACRTGVAPIAPALMPALPNDTAGAWVRELIPDGPRRYDVRWTVETQKGQVRGRASVRVVPPDSLRFDFRAPFGRSGAAVIIGDSLHWAKPEDRNPVPPAPLFWATLGIPLSAPVSAEITGRAIEGERAWRYAHAGDTLTYVIQTASSRRLRTLFRRKGDVVGTVETSFDETSQLPTQSTVLFPASGALFLMTVQEVVPFTEVDPTMWLEP